MGIVRRHTICRWIVSITAIFLFNTIHAQDLTVVKKTPLKLKDKSIHAAGDTLTDKRKLLEVLKELNESKGVYFLFSNKTFGDKLVSPVSDLNQPIEKILAELLKNTGLRSQKINDKTFVIVRRPAGSPETTETAAASPGVVTFTDSTATAEIETTASVGRTIRGKVTSTDGQPLSRVSIAVKGTNTGSVSGTNGEFSIDCSKGDILEFSFVGYNKKQVTVSSSNYITTELMMNNSQLDEVVVTALGVKKDQKSLGYSITSLNNQQLTASGNTNFASALYGKVPGIRITTAPGGATSAVQVQIRGLNSLNFNEQPLYVLDGVVMRNTNEKGSAGINNNGYWDDQRIRGNGILDINPADIETLTVLKGASATALYGSEAASGVIVITTKKGIKKQGLGVEFNYSLSAEQAAFLPRYQNVYGPGFDRNTNLANGATEDGWIPVDTNGDGIIDNYRPNFKAYTQFGPKMEGQLVPWWDGKMRPYTAQPDNYKDLYRTGFSSITNVAVANQSDKASYRISYTRNDYKGIQVGGSLVKNIFNFNNTVKISKRVSTDFSLSFVNSHVHNRPYQLNRIIASYSGFLSRAEDMSVMFEKYQTSKGYKWVPWDKPQLNPAEALRYDMKNETLSFLWMQLRNSEDEEQNRLFSSLTINFDILKNLRLRGRIGNDFTGLSTDTKQYNEYPVAFNSSSSTGSYGIATGRYSIIYGDALLTYSKKINKDLDFSVNGGYQGRDEHYTDQSSTTNGGLVRENWFSLNNSLSAVTTKLNRSAVLKYALLAFADLNVKNYLFLEATARKEYSSTLPPGNNSFFYPSVNSSFILSNVIKMPSCINYARLRGSYGVVGNAPPPYAAAITYTQTTLPTVNGPVGSLAAQVNAGNNKIRPENKHEMEFGLETSLFAGRIGIDITYYNSRTLNQILQQTIPSSTGAISKLVNSGVLASRGMELSLSVVPVVKKEFKWQTVFNASLDRTMVKKLADGIQRIIYYDAEQGALRVVAEEGETVGNIYVYPKQTNVKGQDVIGANGLYIIDNTQYKKAGNIMPKVTGGILNSVSWKNFSLQCMVDYRIGGQLVAPTLKYNVGAGMYESTLQYRDAEHGGLTYYIDKNGAKQLLPSNAQQAPGGARIYHDGLILKGVTINGNDNNTIVDAAFYYSNVFGWGATSLNDEGSVYDNSYFKMREAVLSYALPAKFSARMHVSSIRASLIGRNLFYLWRTLKNLDPEAPIGSSWVRQNIEEGSMAATRSYGFSLNVIF